jgi:hypothetical protein
MTAGQLLCTAGVSSDGRGWPSITVPRAKAPALEIFSASQLQGKQPRPGMAASTAPGSHVIVATYVYSDPAAATPGAGMQNSEGRVRVILQENRTFYG